jgi:hypothetical protein
MKTAVLERCVRSELHVEVEQEVTINVEQDIANNFSDIVFFNFSTNLQKNYFYININFMGSNEHSIYKRIESINCDTLFRIKSDSILLCPHMYEFELNLILERYDVFCKNILTGEKDTCKFEIEYICLYTILLVTFKLYNKKIYPLLINTSLTFENKKIIQSILLIPKTEDLSIPQAVDINYLPIERYLKEIDIKKSCSTFRNFTKNGRTIDISDDWNT